MSASEQAPFHTLVKLIERELELAGQGQLAELEDAVTRTGAHMRTLPAPAPAAAVPLVLRAQALRARVTIDTERLRENIALRRSALRRSRRVARTYAPPRRDQYTTEA